MKLLLFIKHFVLILSISVLTTILCGTAQGFPELTKEEKLFYSNSGGVVILTAWGLMNWDYGDKSPTAKPEGWFSQNTKEGGADKLGHFYSSYVVSHGLSYLCSSWGFTREEASKYGAWSSFGLMSFMEVGDSFSHYGFSYEDFLMNLFGCYTGYVLYKYPKISKKLDIRVEYIPDFDQTDMLTDYENMKFILALKLCGFNSITNRYLKALELQLGYYARGYDKNHAQNKRYAYLGVGVNVPWLISKTSLKKISKLFNYYQLPYTYLPLKRNLQN